MTLHLCSAAKVDLISATHKPINAKKGYELFKIIGKAVVGKTNHMNSLKF